VSRSFSRAGWVRPRFALFATCLLGSWLLVACGGGGGDSAAPAAVTPPTTTPPTTPPPPPPPPAGAGAATLSWVAPNENVDGSALLDLAGFKIYWGTTSGNYPNVVTLNGTGTLTYMVESLAPGTYYFVATAFDSDGNESAFSNEASKTVL